MDLTEKVFRFLASFSKKAFTALLVGSIMAILIGSVLLIITYIVLNSVINSTGFLTNAVLNNSMFANIAVIVQALNIVGISLIVAGIAGIIYMLLGVAGITGSGRH